MESFTVAPWIIWLIISLICITSEIFIPGFWIAVLGVGALVASLSSVFIDSLNAQLFIFSISSVITLIFIRPFVVKKLLKNNSDIKMNASSLVGRTVTVIEQIDNKHSKGKVKIGGEVWNAISETSSIIAVDREVVIDKVDGAKVYVNLIKGE